jgi:hypothetical protein
MDPASNATLHRRGSGTLIERWLASGTMGSLVKRVMLEQPVKRREFVIMHDGMEYQSAEIQNLAGQYIFSESYRPDEGRPVPVYRKSRARKK